MKRLIIAASTVIALLSSIKTSASDAQYWPAIQVEGELCKGLTLHMAEELRFSDNMSHLYYSQTDIGLAYRVTEWFKAGAIYRQVFEDRGYDVDKSFDTWRNEKRPILNWSFDLKAKHINISDRNQFEFRFIDGAKFNVRYRNRLTLEVPFKFEEITVSPFIADEIFVNINDGVLNINRFYAGNRFRFFDKFVFELYYMLQSSKRPDGWKRFNTLGSKIGVTF